MGAWSCLLSDEAPRFFFINRQAGAKGIKTYYPMQKLAYTLLLFIAIITGCSSQKKILNTWIGSSKYNLIQSWGPPSRTADDGNGGEVLIYADQVYAPELHLNYWNYKMMYAHPNGIIYHWRTSRKEIPPTQVNVTFLN